MANFNEPYLLTLHNEGGYSNDINDHGGETYAGIARKFWPNWSGWGLIDKYKQTNNGVSNINSAMSANTVMQGFVKSFYKQNFWDVNKLDLINDQQIANNVYDFGVNSGTVQAAKFLQRAAGVVSDGIVGNQTITAVNEDEADKIYDSINEQRIAFYNKLAQAPGQLQFLKSWLSRIKPYEQPV